jgi:hypothetical protein
LRIVQKKPNSDTELKGISDVIVAELKLQDALVNSLLAEFADGVAFGRYRGSAPL